jgi:hypothetical protein
MKPKKPKQRIWAPKVRAETFKDRRTKRNRTRGDIKRNIMKDQ